MPTKPAALSPEAKRQRLALLVAFALILVWGANFSIQKQVFSAMGPGGFLFGRYLLMPLCALILLVSLYGLRFPRVSRSEFWTLARLGFIGHFLHVGLVTYGIHWSTAFSSSVILACGPLFTLLILRAHQLERLGRWQVMGVGLACLGVLIFMAEKLMGSRWQATGGDLVLLIAASFFSYYTVLAKPVIERHGGMLTMAYATLLGSIPVVVVTFPAALQVDWSGLSWGIWTGFVWAVVVSAFLGWMVWGWINAVRGVARSAPLMYLMPPVAGLLAWLFAGETFSAQKITGALISLLGVAIAQFAQVPAWPRFTSRSHKND
jgi:drug/metabolite transporter (DMT)-like permease